MKGLLTLSQLIGILSVQYALWKITNDPLLGVFTLCNLVLLLAYFVFEQKKTP